LGGLDIEPNAVYMMYTKDEGKTWSPPLTIADSATTGGTTALWPFAVAGAAGNVSVAWYQSNQLTDPDCDSAALMSNGQPSQWTIHVANITGATSSTTTYPPPSVNAVPNFDGLHPAGVFHVGGICQSGTTCVATGQDRRLGDYLTTALDQNGCLMIATGDTVLTDTVTGDQFSTSRPLFLQQASGPSLTTGATCTSALATGPANTPETPLVPGLAITGAAVTTGVVAMRRRRRPRLD
ncbi:MAG: hypothetical protein JOY68_09905, partial [Candidatus Dormibacteraeota bacterium]|nr:hypothetical protein [Candidatus Dormibacteraeota bacterium]